MRVFALLFTLIFIAYSNDSFFTYGFWLGLDDRDIFISGDEKGGFSYPNAVFAFPKSDFTSEMRNNLIKGSLVTKTKLMKAKSMLRDDGIIYKVYDFNNALQKGIKGDYLCNKPCVFKASIKEGLESSLLFKMPNESSEVLLELVSKKDKIYVIGKISNNKINKDSKATSYYQSIVIRHDALAFLGYIKVDGLKSDAEFKEDIIKQLGDDKDFPLQISLKSLQDEQKRVNTNNLRAYYLNGELKIPTKSYRYLWLDDNINNVIDSFDRARLEEFVKQFGKRNLTFSVYIQFLPKPWISDFSLDRILKSKGLDTKQHLCLRNEAIIKDINGKALDKLRLANAFITLEKENNDSYDVKIYNSPYNAFSLTLASYYTISKDYLMPCNKLDIGSLPKYDLASKYISNIANIAYKNIGDSVEVVYKNGKMIGFKEKFSSLDTALEELDSRLKKIYKGIDLSPRLDRVINFKGEDIIPSEYSYINLGEKILLFDNNMLYIVGQDFLSSINLIMLERAEEE